MKLCIQSMFVCFQNEGAMLHDTHLMTNHAFEENFNRWAHKEDPI